MIYYTSSDSRKYLIENEENWIKVQQINFENSIHLSICDPLGKGIRNYLPNEKTPQIFDYEMSKGYLIFLKFNNFIDLFHLSIIALIIYL